VDKNEVKEAINFLNEKYKQSSKLLEDWK